MEHDPEQAIERDAAELEERVDRLGEQIDDAKELADEQAPADDDD